MQEARLAPNALYVISPADSPHVVIRQDGSYSCPYCSHGYQDKAAAWNGESTTLGKCQAKKVHLTLLLHPQWLNGSAGLDAEGKPLGGSMTDTHESTRAWNLERHKNLSLIEVRGDLPEVISCPDTGQLLFTDAKGGTMPRRAAFSCQQSTCGLAQDLYESLGKFGKTGPVSIYAIQVFCPSCEESGVPSGGRYFDTPKTTDSFDVANKEWQQRKDRDLEEYWPKSEIPYGLTTHIDRPLNQHGYTHWYTMFNPRQLLVHAQLLKSIVSGTDFSQTAREQLLGAFQQYLRNQNMFCFWNAQRALEPMFSNNNFAPKLTVVENSVFSGLGRGDFTSSANKMIEALRWNESPWEIVSLDGGKHSQKVSMNDAPVGKATLESRSATSLPDLADESIDLVITDPPFGNLLHYSELADFFYYPGNKEGHIPTRRALFDVALLWTGFITRPGIPWGNCYG